MDNQLALVLSPGFVEDLGDLPMEDVRARRTICQRLEAGHSLLRRIVQGRLDIVGSELARRSGGQDMGDAGDVGLISQLPNILSEPRAANSPGRPPTSVAPELVDEGLAAEIESIVSPQQMADLAGLGDVELSAAAEELEALERKVSEQRHSLHVRIDVIQSEVMRRYRTGEATVDSLLS